MSSGSGMADAIQNFSIADDRVFTDYRKCLEVTRPDIVILCPAAASHGEWTAKVAPYGVHLLVEKPFAATLSEADAMIAAMAGSGNQLAINWPLAWYPSHRTDEATDRRRGHWPGAGSAFLRRQSWAALALGRQDRGDRRPSGGR